MHAHSLPALQNAFWSLGNTDVYSAISWDRLHAYHGGLFSDHIWVLFKNLLGELGRESASRFDAQYVLTLFDQSGKTQE